MSRSLAFLAVVFLAAPALAADPKPLEFRLTYDPAIFAGPFTGRVFVAITPAKPAPVMDGLNWFNPEPLVAKDVTDWKAGRPIALTEGTIATTAFTNLKPGRYYVQAIMDRDLGGISFGNSPGNLYSTPVGLDLDPATSGRIELTLDKVAGDRTFKDTDNVKLVEVPSPLLTKFHGKPMTTRGAVVLPPSFGKEPTRKYPVIYVITGFGGDHFSAFGYSRKTALDGIEVIHVVLDANCRTGHHVFADSATNGPVGTALVEEFIPAVERRYRGAMSPAARFVTGHSSGGWSSLWLQVAYPDTFGGCWSTSPDPVDFRDFQRIDIYNPKSNMFADLDGARRPIARRGEAPVLYYRPFSDMEVVMGRGGQLQSFEAVFSPKGKDGKPMPLWDRKSGAIDLEVAKAWEKYDIRLKLEREWKTTGPKLAGKVHVWMGDIDTFYLDGATRLLKESVAKLKSDAIVEMFPGKDHGLVDGKLHKRMDLEMAAAIRAWEAKQKTE